MDISFNNYGKLDDNTTVSQHSQGVNWDNSSNIICTDLIWVPSSKHTRISPDIDPKYNFITDKYKYNTFSKSTLSNIAYISNEEEEEDNDEISSQSTDSSVVNDKSTYYCHSISSNDSLYINNDNSYQNNNSLIQMKDRSQNKNREEKLSHQNNNNNTKHITTKTTTLLKTKNSPNFNHAKSDTNCITDFHEIITEYNKSINSNIIIEDNDSIKTVYKNESSINNNKIKKSSNQHQNHNIHHIKTPSNHYHPLSSSLLSQKQQHRKSFSEYMMINHKKEKKSFFSTIFHHRNTKNINNYNNNNNNNKRYSLNIDSLTTISDSTNNNKLFSFISIKSIIPPSLSKKSSSSLSSSLSKKKKNSKDSSIESPPPPPIFEIDYVENKRLPIQLERGIYRLSHSKLMDYQRPLHQQVIISNLMYWYLSLTNPNIKRQKPKSLSSPDNYMEDNIRYINVTKRKMSIPQRVSSPPLKNKWNHKLNTSPLR